MSIRFLLTLISVLAFFLTSNTTVASTAKQLDPRTEPPKVRVSSVQNAIAVSRSFTGIVAARIQSDLGFRVSGKISERLVDTGETVKRGQPLMKLDNSDLQLQMQAQDEAVAAALANAKQAAAEEERYRKLLGHNVVSHSKYDQVKATADSTKAQLKAAHAQQNVAKNALSYAILLADADGVVVETLAEPGQVISAGQTVVRLARAGKREAVINLPETVRPEIGSSAEATLYGKPQTATAILRQLSSAADSATRTYQARYTLQDSLANSPIGATVTLNIMDNIQATDTLQVPLSAVFDAGKGSGVWLIQGDNPSKVSWRSVEVIRLSDETAWVKGDLKIGERVVALGVHLLREDQIVRPILETGAAQ
ncbi:efflux RND transporter periplasmic adaptor subunit [Pasteurella testudinis]|uniref:efflux RND transporter periplasmic adaptor subunit n=1 Tax=Pasteurella testudinis TaxID=761 RepID=UPI0040594459